MESKKKLLESLPQVPSDSREKLNAALSGFDRKIIVLDDDPTGIQTVHDVYVYTDWEKESMKNVFEAAESMFFILTNSRGCTARETIALHREIAHSVLWAAQETGKKFVLISRGDSTLRGHYPLEPEVLRKEIERRSPVHYDGEILMPFFPEGGRFTIHDVHYVAYGDDLIPAGETEFARDKTFGYHASNLLEYIQEKSGGKYQKDSIVSISIDELRRGDIDAIARRLETVSDFGKVVVNAACYEDVEIFVAALVTAIRNGKEFLMRTAAAVPKVLGNISDKPLLEQDELIDRDSPYGGLIIAGSHVNKTTLQLERLRRADHIHFVEFNQHLVMDDAAFAEECRRVNQEVDSCLRKGTDVAVYTRRERFDLNTGNREEELGIAVKISEAVTGVVKALQIKPRFIIAKGGITSSDIGVHALRVKKARVLGQILPGIPVWKTGPESRFPGMSYVIFPGNVGSEDALLQAVQKMQLPKEQRNMRMKDKVAVVTGAAQGIGLAVAKRLCAEGARVVLLDVNEEKLLQAVSALDCRVKYKVCNVAELQQVLGVFDQILQEEKRIDILVNNAGITRDAMFHKMDEEEWDLVLNVNLKGIFNCCKAVVPSMRDRRYGKIVNLSSVSSFGNIGQTNYGASKAGVIGFTKCLAKELARYGCTVNAVAPSYVNTEMLRAVPDHVMQKFLSAVPMNRLGEPEELAAVVAFLSSDDSSFVTGECIVVSGGSYM